VASATDQRATPRRRVCYGAQIAIDPALAPAEVLVRNISDGGAAVRVLGGRLLPDPFQLSVEHGRIARSAHIVWKKGDDIGVSFDKASAREANRFDGRSSGWR
jgi:PilZ domain